MRQPPVFQKYIQTVLTAVGSALLALTLLATIAAAHALLVKSEPADGVILAQAPAQVATWFSQELDTGFSTLQVFEAGGRQVDLGDGGVDLYDPDHASMRVSLPESLPGGTYRVYWSVVSADDGDSTEGEFSFSIGQAGSISQAAPAKPAQPNPFGDLPLGWIIAALGIVSMAALGYFRLRPRER